MDDLDNLQKHVERYQRSAAMLNDWVMAAALLQLAAKIELEARIRPPPACLSLQRRQFVVA